MKVSVRNLILVSLAAALTACQAMPYQPYARDVKKKPGTGGIIALKPEHRDEDTMKAQQMMAANCGTHPVKVVEEGEVAVGQEVKSNADTTHNAGTNSQPMGTFFGLPVTSVGTAPSNSTSGTSVTTAVKEWQINYECLTAATAAATPAPVKAKKVK